MVAGSRKKALRVTPNPRKSSVRKRVVAFLSMTVLASIAVSLTSTVTYSVGGRGLGLSQSAICTCIYAGIDQYTCTCIEESLVILT